MKNFIRKIKIDDTINDLFLSFLLNEKYQVPSIGREQERLILYVSERFLFSGFLLKSCDFNLSHKNLVEKLKDQRRIQSLKQMSLRNDLKNIARNFNEKGIKHVVLKGFALNSDGIYPAGVRTSRDIDLLVSQDLLTEAYDLLKVLGFKYLNSKTQDSAKYNHFGNHLPPMINENNTKLELHWRVTHSRDFENCPVTENILANRRVSKTDPHIFCPKIEATIAHLIHHSIDHHYINLGPIFLYDLAAIFVFFNKKWPINNELHKKLGIEKKFELCKNLIEKASNEPRFSIESKLLLNQIFKNSHWLRLSEESNITNSLLKMTSIEFIEKQNFLSKVSSKLRYIRTDYQVSYYSPKFWFLFVSDIFNFFKRVMR